MARLIYAPLAYLLQVKKCDGVPKRIVGMGGSYPLDCYDCQSTCGDNNNKSILFLKRNRGVLPKGEC